jgi:hypothetical protein
MQNLFDPTKPRQRRSNLDCGCVISSVRLDPPPVRDEPTKVKALNLPEEPDEEGWLGGDRVAEPDDVWRVGRVASRVDEKSCQVSSSNEVSLVVGEGADILTVEGNYSTRGGKSGDDQRSVRGTTSFAIAPPQRREEGKTTSTGRKDEDK